MRTITIPDESDYPTNEQLVAGAEEIGQLIRKVDSIMTEFLNEYCPYCEVGTVIKVNIENKLFTFIRAGKCLRLFCDVEQKPAVQLGMIGRHRIAEHVSDLACSLTKKEVLLYTFDHIKRQLLSI